MTEKLQALIKISSNDNRDRLRLKEFRNMNFCSFFFVLCVNYSMGDVERRVFIFRGEQLWQKKKTEHAVPPVACWRI